MHEYDSINSISRVPFDVDLNESFQSWLEESDITTKDKYGISKRIEPDSNLFTEYLFFEEYLCRRTPWLQKEISPIYPYKFGQIADSLMQTEHYENYLDESPYFTIEWQSVIKDSLLFKIGKKMALVQYSFDQKQTRFDFKGALLVYGGLILSSALLLFLGLALWKFAKYIRHKIRSTSKKKILIITGIFILFLILTNPSLSELEEHGHSLGVKKMNFLVCSIYETRRGTYLGIAMNFIRIGNGRSGIATAS